MVQMALLLTELDYTWKESQDTMQQVQIVSASKLELGWLVW
jgi:hypothetical protein